MTCETGALHLGIDLGASRSTICASDGSRQTAPSALSGESLSDMISSSPRGDPSPRDAARKVRAVIAVPSAVAEEDRDSLYRSFAGVLDSLILVPDLLAVAYGMDALAGAMVIDIGATRTDLCVFAGHLPSEEEQPSLAIAGNSIDRQMVANLAQQHPGLSLSLERVRSWKERHGFVGPRAKPILVSTTVDDANNGVRAKIDITDAMRKSCESILPPLIRTMLDLLQRSSPAVQRVVRHNILLTGGSSLIHGLASRLQASLRRTGGGTVRRLMDPTFAAAAGSLAMANDLSDGAWDQLAVI